MNRLGTVAVGAAVVESLRPTLVPRTTRHQALVTAACAVTGAVVSQPVARLPVPRWVVPAALALGAWRAGVHAKAQSRSHPDWDPRPQNTPLAVAAGALAGWAVSHAPVVAVRASRAGGRALASRHAGPAGLWAVGVAALAATGLAGAAAAGARVGLRRLREIGTRADAALGDPPSSSYVSGGPASGIDYSTLARDGRRFVSLRTPAAEIATVTGDAEEPIRVYVGLQTADTVEQRVEIALAELERLGGFERSTLVIMCPAGSGYADYVAAEAIECFTRGDVASVVVQYGVLPSMLSLGRIGLGARTTRLLLERVLERATGTVLIYGESLGARVAQDALQLEPSFVTPDGRVDGLHAVVSVGTPGGPSLRDRLRTSPGVVHLDRWQQLTGAEDAQLWFLDHDADPVTKWDHRLALRVPFWLRRPRGRNVPDDMAWLPVLTWWQVLFDLTFAAQQQSGVFHSVGHDYRADLAPVLAAVLGADVDVEAVARLLAIREVVRDEMMGLKLPKVST